MSTDYYELARERDIRWEVLACPTCGPLVEQLQPALPRPLLTCIKCGLPLVRKPDEP